MLLANSPPPKHGGKRRHNRPSRAQRQKPVRLSGKDRQRAGVHVRNLKRHNGSSARRPANWSACALKPKAFDTKRIGSAKTPFSRPRNRGRPTRQADLPTPKRNGKSTPLASSPMRPPASKRPKERWHN